MLVAWWWRGGGGDGMVVVVVWWYGSMVGWLDGGMVVWWYGGMVVWWYGGMVVWWYGDVTGRPGTFSPYPMPDGMVSVALPPTFISCSPSVHLRTGPVANRGVRCVVYISSGLCPDCKGPSADNVGY